MAIAEKQPRRFSRKTKYAILAAAAAIIVIAASFWLIGQRHTSISLALPADAVNPVVGAIQPSADYYLTLQGNATKIYVVSVNVTSGYYPYDTRSGFGGQEVTYGEPCLIINVTVRNDYSTQYPPPMQYPGLPTFAYVFLTAQIFHGNTEIKATDLTQAGLPADSYSYATLNGGQTGTVSVYLATTSKSEVTSYKIIPVWVGGLPLA